MGVNNPIPLQRPDLSANPDVKSRYRRTARLMRRLTRGARRAMARREDDVERQQSLKRMRAGLDERTDVLADQTALADIDHLFCCLPLRRRELVFPGHGVEVTEYPVPELLAVA